ISGTKKLDIKTQLHNHLHIFFLTMLYKSFYILIYLNMCLVSCIASTGLNATVFCFSVHMLNEIRTKSILM
ncbi:hypothetical protein ACJX0J_029017, partial [Zea mays]